MLPEIKAVRAESVDGGTTLVVHAGRDLGPPRHAACRVLLDSTGAVLGLDVDPQGERLVLMLGEHEDVHATLEARVELQGERAHVTASAPLRLR